MHNSHYLLDTNCYALLFKRPIDIRYQNLMSLFSDNIHFYISEITSMEIHSVLGKYRRGIQPQRQKCDRQIFLNGSEKKCENLWVTRGRKKLKPKIYRGMLKLLSDIESGRGTIKTTMIEINEHTVSFAKSILYQYSDKYNFGSHDAMIAGSVIDFRNKNHEDLTLVTSDKGFKSVLQELSIPIFDPNQVSQV